MPVCHSIHIMVSISPLNPCDFQLAKIGMRKRNHLSSLQLNDLGREKWTKGLSSMNKISLGNRILEIGSHQ